MVDGTTTSGGLRAAGRSLGVTSYRRLALRARQQAFQVVGPQGQSRPGRRQARTRPKRWAGRLAGRHPGRRRLQVQLGAEDVGGLLVGTGAAARGPSARSAPAATPRQVAQRQLDWLANHVTDMDFQVVAECPPNGVSEKETLSRCGEACRDRCTRFLTRSTFRSKSLSSAPPTLTRSNSGPIPSQDASRATLRNCGHSARTGSGNVVRLVVQARSTCSGRDPAVDEELEYPLRARAASTARRRRSKATRSSPDCPRVTARTAESPE